MSSNKVVLSGIVIAKNSENVLVDCLNSLSFCDEIIVVDNASTDRTVSIAKKFHAKVINAENKSFAKRRDIGKEYASGEWILYIDTDERVSPELKREIQHAIKDGSYAGYYLQRKNYYLGNHAWPKIEKLQRLFQRKLLHKWVGDLHETPFVEGKLGFLEGYILHYTHRDLASMLNKTIVWSEVEANLRLQAHHPKMSWWRFFRVIITGFFDSYIKQEGYKVGTAGLVESIYQSYSMFITYARLWELQQNK